MFPIQPTWAVSLDCHMLGMVGTGLMKTIHGLDYVRTKRPLAVDRVAATTEVAERTCAPLKFEPAQSQVGHEGPARSESSRVRVQQAVPRDCIASIRSVEMAAAEQGASEATDGIARTQNTTADTGPASAEAQTISSGTASKSPHSLWHRLTRASQTRLPSTIARSGCGGCKPSKSRV